MGDKYIIELGEKERAYKTVDSDGWPMIMLLAPTPYTEPDLDAIRKEAYKEGREAGIKDGMCEAWEAARKIASDNAGGNYSIFGQHFTVEILNTHSASECIEKIRQYEQEQKQLYVGDEVNAPFGKAIVVNIDSVAEKIWLVYADGHGGFEYFKDAPTKTGRHFPGVAEVMRKMKEAE